MARSLRRGRRRSLRRWRAEGVVVHDDRPALWPLAQEYTGPDGDAGPAGASSRACAWRTTAPDGSAPTSARTRAQGGSAEADARDAREPVPDLLAVLRPRGRCLERARADARSGRPVGRDDRRRRHGQPAVAGRGPGGDRGRAGGARRRRAPDRRRSPPLRDGARVCRGGRRRGRPPLRADVPRRAPGPGADRLPDPPPGQGLTPGSAREACRRAAAEFRDRAARANCGPSRPTPAMRSRSATSTPTSASRSCSRSRTRRSPTPRCANHAEPYRRLDTAVLEALILKGALGDERRRHRPPRTASATRATSTRRSSSCRAPSTTPRSSWLRRRSSTFRRSPRPARACRPSPRTSFPRCPTGLRVQSADVDQHRRPAIRSEQ